MDRACNNTKCWALRTRAISVCLWSYSLHDPPSLPPLSPPDPESPQLDSAGVESRQSLFECVGECAPDAKNKTSKPDEELLEPPSRFPVRRLPLRFVREAGLCPKILPKNLLIRDGTLLLSLSNTPASLNKWFCPYCVANMTPTATICTQGAQSDTFFAK